MKPISPISSITLIFSTTPIKTGVFAAALLAACGPPPAVEFTAAPPSVAPRDYGRIHDRWTRRGHVRSGYDSALNATVTLLSDEMRVAYVAKVAAMRALTDADRATLDARQRDEGARFVEFLVQAETSNWLWNDFSSTTTLWTITLVDDTGRVIAPVELNVAPGKAESWNELFPPVTPFTKTWRIRFPRTLPDGKPLLGPATRSLTLRFAGPLGQTALRWTAK